MKNKKKYILGVIAFLVLLGLDQWTKWLAITSLKPHGEFPLWEGVFVLQYLENRGAAFGMLQNQRVFLLILTSIILIGLILLFIKLPEGKKFGYLRILCVVLAAGAVGNMIDRFFRGFVVDFLYFKLIDFPIFNVADCYVVIAAIVAALLIGFYYSEEDLTFFRLRGKEDGRGSL